MKIVIVVLFLLVACGIFVACNSLKNKPVPRTEFTDEEYDALYELEIAGIEKVLGKRAELVGHAMIPFAIGGAVDMYYFPNGIEGTGFATLELINPDGYGPVESSIGTYELVAFTRLPYMENLEGDFDKIERRMCKVFTALGFYSKEARLNPRETCEVPQKEGKPNICLIFDEYAPDGKQFKIGDRKHGLLLVIEVFPEEMRYAMRNGGQKLLDLLKAKGHYPYSDMNREPVVGDCD